VSQHCPRNGGTFMGAFLNLYEYLMTDRFRWETPVQGGGAGRLLQRLRDARPRQYYAGETDGSRS
jgi:hypothetical protein